MECAVWSVQFVFKVPCLSKVGTFLLFFSTILDTVLSLSNYIPFSKQNQTKTQPEV